MGNWQLVKSILGTQFIGNHVCLHPQADNRVQLLDIRIRLSIFIHCQNYSEVILLFFFML